VYQPPRRQLAELLAQLGRRSHQQGLDGVDGLGAGLDGGLAGGAQRPHHRHGAGAELGRCGGLAGLNRAGGGFGVDRVGLAVAPAGLPVGPVDLDHALAVAA
jgi:hypothetical protein